MRFEILGPLRVYEGGELLELGGPRQRDVLAVLLAAVPDHVSVDRLVDEVWGDRAPSTASHVIRTYISNLRSVLGDRIVSDGQHYRLVLDHDDCDAAELSGSLTSSRILIDIDPRATLDELSEVTRRWRGRPFEDTGEDAYLVRSRAHSLEEQYIQALELRIEAALRLGRHEEVIPELQTLVERFPFREHLTAQLMMALYRAGRQADALQVCSDLRARLVEELGLDPSPELQRLEERVLQQDLSLELGPVHNIPSPVSDFVGRLPEIGEAKKQVEAYRLVTLVGPGGVGKTRLAREVAVNVLAGFPDGVFWIDLAPLREPEAVERQVAGVLGLTARPGLSLIDVIRRFLSQRTVLLVFDNCEHLADAVGDVASRVLESAPKVKVLATARRPLGLAGEVRVDVPPMSLPDLSEPNRVPGTSDAERLFLTRASDVSGERLNAQGAMDDVARLCWRLDGLPLAIEMAAARTRALTTKQVLRRLDQGSDFLVAAEVDRDERQRTLEETIAWSYDLLEPSAQTLFRRISVFAGAFDIEAAQAIACFGGITDDQVLQGVGDLVAASMLTTTRNDSSMRYRMLMTMREFAYRRLEEAGERPDVECRHADHYLSTAAAAGPLRMTPGFADAMAELEVANDDLTTALDWSLQNDPKLATNAAGGLAEYWSRRGEAAKAYRYGKAMLEHSSDASPETRANVLLCASFGAALSGDFELATKGPVEAMALADSGASWQTRLWARHARGQIGTILGDLETVEEMGMSILEVCDQESLDLPRAYGMSLLGLAEFFADRDYALALSRLDRAIEGMRALKDFGGMKAYGLVTAGTAAAMLGDYDAAQRYAADSISVPGAIPWTAMTYITLGGYTLHPMGDFDRATLMLVKGTKLAYETSTEIWVRTGLLFLARIAADRQEWQLAARLFGACRPNLPAWGLQKRWWAPEQQVKQALGPETFDRLRQEGETAELKEAMTWIDQTNA